MSNFKDFADDLQKLCKKHKVKLFLDYGKLSIKSESSTDYGYNRLTDLLPHLPDIMNSKDYNKVFGLENLSDEEIIRRALAKSKK